uniref:NEDD4-binding protein 2-like 1 n=1 Tax=Schistosoma haematobium TaxID=6185 RepID=A0A094ZWV1_SCHHA
MVSEFFAPRCIVPEKSEVQRNLFSYSPEIVRLKNVIYEAYNSKWGTRFLVLLRGVPGSGKSTLARFLVDKLDQRNFLIASNDDYFYDEVEKTHKYNNTELNEAIAACKQKVWSSMYSGVLAIIVDNCNLTRLEMDPFIREVSNLAIRIIKYVIILII